MTRALGRALVLAAAVAAAAGAPLPRAARADGGDEYAAPADPEARLRWRMTRGPLASDPATVDAWSDEMAREGRARTGTAFGADLLAAAAEALTSRRRRRPESLALWREAMASYPDASVGRTRAWLEVAYGLAETKDAAGSAAALDEFERRMAAGLPAVATGLDALQFESLERRRAADVPLARARALTALGRHEEAASLYESLGDHPGGVAADAAALWDEAAAAAWRVGDPARARRDVDRSIALTSDDRDLVSRTGWRLRSLHGLLDEKADPRLPSAWPGDAWLADLRSTLAGLSGRDHAFELAVEGASVALVCSRLAEAVELYAWAFRDPSFQEEAKTSEWDRRRLLTAAQVAVRAGRADLALAWLDAAERFAGTSIAGTEALRADILEALARPAAPREGAAAAPVAPGTGATAGTAGEPAPATGPSTLSTPPTPPGAPEATASGDGAPPARGAGPLEPVLLPSLAVAATLLAIVLALAVARRRRRAARSRGTGPSGPGQPDL